MDSIQSNDKRWVLLVDTDMYQMNKLCSTKIFSFDVQIIYSYLYQIEILK